MFKYSVNFAALLSASVLMAGSAVAQSNFQSGIYQIVSGRYIACCGIAGPIPQTLPNQSQKYIKLDIEQNTARMTILGQDMQTVFGVFPCPPASRIDFDFTHGSVFPSVIFFHTDPGLNQTYWNYTVSNLTSSLAINGVLSTSVGFCSDWPNRFTHTNVVAVLMPRATIRASEMEICWDSTSNSNYQVQYRSNLTTNQWLDLGPPISASGSTTCITDAVPPEEPRRFYRVFAVP